MRSRPPHLLAMLLAAPVAAQSEEPTVTEMLRSLQRDEVPAAQRPEVIRSVLQDGAGACRRLYKQLHKELEDRAGELEQGVLDFRRELQRAAARDVAARWDAAAQREVEAAREVITGLATRSGLTKGQLYGEGDQALAVLEQHLQPDMARLLGEGAELAVARTALERQVEVYRERLLELVQVAQVWRGHPSGERGLKRFPAIEPADRFADALGDGALDATVFTLADGRDRTILERNAALRSELPEQEWRGILETNRRRLLVGRAALATDPRLCAAARDHCKDMRELGFFDHMSPVEGKRTPSDRAANFKTSGGAENIAQGRRTGAGAVQGWWHSPGHFRNLLGNHGRIGLGGHEGYWTQMFGG